MNTCVDCGKETVGYGARCKSCATKKVWEERGTRPKSYCVGCGKEISLGCARCRECYVESKKSESNYCIDCGKKIVRGAMRCKKCSGKNRRKYPEHNYCIDCGEEICNVSIRCQSCATKACWQKPKYCENQAKAWSDPGIRQKRCTSISEAYTPERCQSMSIRSKKMWEDGICGSDEHIQKIAKSVVEAWEQGCYDSEETRQKWSDGTRQSWQDPEFRQRNLASREATFATQEFRAKKSVSGKKAWARGAWDGVNFHPGAPYKTELNVAEVLDRLEVDYQDQYPIGCKRYDFYLPDYNLLIEYDGWYYHHSEWAIENGATERDVKKNKLAEQLGFDLIRLAGLPRRDLTQEEIMIQLLDHLGDRLWA